MRPDKKSITDLFTERSQYLIPLFQRGYVWTLNDQIQPLWEDLIDRLEAIAEHKTNAEKVGGAAKLKPLRRHFLGTVVIGGLKGASSDAVGGREVIDGQQRITTLQILPLVFRDLVQPRGDEGISYDLCMWTRNPGKFRDRNDQLKVWPTNVGRDVMQSLAELGSLDAASAKYRSKVEGKARLAAAADFSRVYTRFISRTRLSEAVR